MEQQDTRLEIKKTVWVKAGIRQYSVDRKPGTKGQPDFYVLTEHKRGTRHKVVITQPDMDKIIEALVEVQK